MKQHPIPGILLHGTWFDAAEWQSGQVAPLLQQLAVPLPVQVFLQTWFGSEHPISAQTSGSTGPQKRVVLSRDQMIASAQLTALHFGFKPGQKVLLPLSADFIAGKMMLVRAMVSGLDIYTAMPSQRPDLLFPAVAFQFTPLVPAQLFAMLQADVSTAALGTLLLGGSDLSPDLAALLPQLGQQALWQGFGMTETVSHVALRQLHPLKSEFYQPLPGLLVQTNEAQCLRVWGSVTNYHWLQSNDVIALQSTGSFSWLGRADNVIISGGHKLHPEQIESRLLQLAEQLPDLTFLKQQPFYIGQQPDPQFGAVAVLVVEGNASPEIPALEQLQTSLKPHFQSFERIRHLRFEPQFARTPNGKLFRN